ncbi:DUF2147 domain-containing protein [Crocinitomix sp.]|nr:DUF2147 domain-containing protein [Crocinitomix sp.]
MKGLFISLLLSVSSAAFSEVKADALMGVWLTEIKDAKITIYKKANKYYGRVSWMKETNDENGNPLIDKNNPNENLRNRKIFGMDILIGFVYDNDGEWDGKIYDPKNGTTYTCKLWLDKNNLKVRGYLGWLFDTKVWTKAV